MTRRERRTERRTERRIGRGSKRQEAEQLTLDFERGRWGGARKGAGRKRSPDSGVSHLTRAALASRFPVHVTMRMMGGLPSLRRKHAYKALARAFAAGCERGGFRLTQYSVQSNHLHLLVEAKDRRALSRGMQGLSIRVARGLNKLWKREGRVFADRYHDRILRTPREVRNALAYVLCNAKRHGIFEAGPDWFSSARWFDGWRERWFEPETRPGPIARARTWLLAQGWRRSGRIPMETVPG